jgi:diacylglycerol kinase (ATP)
MNRELRSTDSGTELSSTMTRLVVITNFNAGRNRSRPDVIRRLTRDAGGHCLQAEDLESIRRATREAVQRGVDVLAVNGGDGTVHGALTEIMHLDTRLPDLAIIPGGTTNMTANDLNANAPLEGCLRQLAAQVQLSPESRARVRRPMLRVFREPQAAQYGFFLGAGIVLDGMAHFRKKVASHGLRGELAAGISLLRGLGGMARGEGAWVASHSMSFVEHDRKERHDDQVLLMATSLERLLLEMRPWWGQRPCPIHLTSVRRRPKAVMRRARGLLTGRPHPKMTSSEGYFSENVTAFDLYADGAFALDGEIFAVEPGEPVRVEATAPISFLNLQQAGG